MQSLQSFMVLGFCLFILQLVSILIDILQNVMRKGFLVFFFFLNKIKKRFKMFHFQMHLSFIHCYFYHYNNLFGIV